MRRLAIIGSIILGLVAPAIGATYQYRDNLNQLFNVLIWPCGGGYCTGMVLEDSSGTEKATQANPLRIDPTGTTTQPVQVAASVLPSGAATSANQINGAQKSQIVDGAGNVIASTSNNLNVQCANCSGTGASAVDEASYTAGASVFAPAGGFFQTTATNGPLSNGQQGMWQMTAQRAGFVNIRNASGTEVGTASNPFQVNGSNGTFPASQSGSWTVQPGNTPNTTPWLASIAQGGNTAVVKAGNTVGSTDVAVAVGVTNVNSNGQAAMAASSPVAIASDQKVADPCMFQAKTNVPISTASGTTALVTGVSAKKIYICSLVLIAPSAVSVSLSEGSSATCGTSNQAGVIGVATNVSAANGLPLAANGGLTLGNGQGTVAATATNADYLCLFQSGTAQIAGNLTYVQQ